jgi:hypothetical protein
MDIRPPAHYEAYAGSWVYIGKPFTNPKIDGNKLSLFDVASGEPVSNPFYVDNDGYARNKNQPRVTPKCAEYAYSIYVESPAGGLVYEYQKIESDAIEVVPDDGSSMMVDETWIDWPTAKTKDMTEESLIYIQSREEWWLDGPVFGYYAYKVLDESGTPETGTWDDFFDAAGNRWKVTSESNKKFINEQAIIEVDERLTPIVSANTEAAADAQSAADDAQGTADGAVVDAAAAQSTADTAVSAAENAQGTADDAVTDAATANGKADANALQILNQKVYSFKVNEDATIEGLSPAGWTVEGTQFLGATYVVTHNEGSTVYPIINIEDGTGTRVFIISNTSNSFTYRNNSDSGQATQIPVYIMVQPNPNS